MNERVCAVCGKPLPPRRMKYCSDECRKADENQRRSAMTQGRHGPKRQMLICQDCGREALVYPKSIRCPDCQKEADDRALADFRRRKAAGKTRPIGSVDICQRCGQPYTVNAGLQKYCKACAGEALREHNRVKALELYHDKYDGNPEEKERRSKKRRLPRYSPILCRVCGSEFIPETRHAAYCSPKCADIGHKAQCSQWMKTHREEQNEYMRRFRAQKKGEKQNGE